MAFCSVVAAFMIKVLGMGGQIAAPAPAPRPGGGGASQPPSAGGGGMSVEFYLMTFGPVAVLFSVSLWLGNLAYLYLEVSYIQMLKAGNVVLVFFVGCLLGTEKPLLTTLANCLWIGLGLFVASYSEANFVLVGFLVQFFGVIAEAFRLQLVQMLLSSKGLKLNPITSLYYLSPLCFACLLLPFAIIELPRLQNRMQREGAFPVPVWMLLANASTALGLNLSVYALIGQTSALTMNVAGVVKDWLIIIMSAYLFGNLVSSMQVGGYLFAFLGVLYYNQQRVISKQKEAEAAKAAQADQGGDTGEEKKGLLDGVLVGNGDGNADAGGPDKGGEKTGDAAV